MLAIALSVMVAFAPNAGITFGKPRRIGPTDGMADDFYAVGPLGSRVVFGIRTSPSGNPQTSSYPTTEATMSHSAGRTWQPVPDSCANVVSHDRRYTLAAYNSACSDLDPSVCTALTTFGEFGHIATPTTSANTIFNATGATVLRYTNGTLECQEKPGVTKIAGLPPLMECCSVGGLRFSGAAAIYLGPGGENRYLTTILGSLAAGHGQDRMTIMAVGSTDGISWRYISTIANYSTPNMNSAEGGPNEMDLAWLPDNERILAMIRVCAGAVNLCTQNYARSVSSDRGKTWSMPEFVPNVGSARPRLLQMGNTMILGGGRMWNGGDMKDHLNLHNGTNDNLLWTATDGEGLMWKPYAISYYHNRGESDPSLHFTAGVNSSLYYGEDTLGMRHLDFETHGYLSLVQLTRSSGLVIYQYTGRTYVNETRQCSEPSIRYLFERKVWGHNTTGKAACVAANMSRNIGRTFYWNEARGTSADSCGHQACDCCWTGRSIAEPMKNGTFAMEFIVAEHN
eukprot:COSAG02_NODE_2816_length_7969_cov_3.879670_2_plen_511_part_00